MIEENIIIKSPSKPTKEDDGEKKVSRKQPTPAERGEGLLLFPYMIVDASLDGQNMEDIANDLEVTEEYDKWAREYTGKEYTSEYQQAYEGFRKRLKTLPEKKESKKVEETAVVSMTVSESSTIQQQSQSSPQPPVNRQQVKDEAYEVAMLNYKAGNAIDRAGQIAILKRGKCPKCGRNMTPRTVSSDGSRFMVCTYSECNYKANGTKEEPMPKYDKVIPIINRIALT